MQIIEREFSVGEFRRIALEEAKRQLTRAREDAERAAAGGFVRRVPPPILKLSSLDEFAADITALAQETAEKFPDLTALVQKTESLTLVLLRADSAEVLLDTYRRLLTTYRLISDEPSKPDAFSLYTRNGVIVLASEALADDPDGAPSWAVESDRADQTFVARVSNLIAASRRAGRALSQDEHSAVLGAYRLLDKGARVPSAYRGIGLYGFRQHQTNLSIANPGDGHITVTCASSQLLDGVFIHVEHIDRDGERDREKLEPYRLPASINTARVRLHAGSSAACTAYVGRPVFESGDVKRDMLKSVHMTASACTAMFANGIADCKIGIERMKASEAVAFMRAVAGNVVRDQTRQYLSGAFNINLPQIDDRGDQLKTITDRLEIARLGIELAVEGRFEKVAWDGSSNLEPSVPIVEQMPYEQLLELVHIAHERGLETYVSAGLQPHHMQACVHVGVDGVGIGTSLHDYNPASGLRGQLKAERVREVLTVRDAAAADSLGRGARLLARMDRLFFEGTLPIALEAQRQNLFQAMLARDEVLIASIADDVGEPSPVEPGHDHPVMEQAKRVLASSRTQTVGSERDKAWPQFVESVRELVDRQDIQQLYETLP
ncbi:hypothetical protein HP062_18045 [Pseudomonas sp. B14-6]|uniref:hypothetical protein n=1 Tax=Pseudomonas sp. B14-6 TaxID=2738843 RepID=UPI00155E227A|nr:hypothetical protein [Pseudomonas sp. B14-6]QKG67327.1 hypothetical protein HP062_18045 [Pseudomonas sp. B14-6]